MFDLLIVCRDGGNASGNGGERAGGAGFQGSGGVVDRGGKPEANTLPLIRPLALLFFVLDRFYNSLSELFCRNRCSFVGQVAKRAGEEK